MIIVKTFIFNLLVLLNWPFGELNFPNKDTNVTYEIIKINTYHGNDLETVYKINCKNKKTNHSRFFEIIKSNKTIKNYFLINFIIVEKVKEGKKTVLYPTGWESVKAIKENELKETCQLIIAGDIMPELIE